VHGLGQADLVAPVVLGAVKRFVGHLEDRRVVEGLAGLGGADAEAHRDRDAAGDAVGSHALAQLLGERRRLLEVGPGQQDQELLAAESIGEVESAQLLAQLVGDLLEHDVADRMAARVVDHLEVVEVSDDDADRLTGQLGLLRELDHARAERLAVEHAGQLVDHSVAAVLDVRAHERRGEHRYAQKKGDRRDQQHRIVDDCVRVDSKRHGHEDRDVDDHARDYAAHGESRAQRDDGNRQPRQRRDVRTAAQGHGPPDHKTTAHPRAEHQQLGSRDLRHQLVRKAEADRRGDDEDGRPPPEPWAHRNERERDDREGALPDGPHALLHVEHAFAVEVVAAQPRADACPCLPRVWSCASHQLFARRDRRAR